MSQDSTPDRLAQLRRIVELDPDDPASWFLLGREAAAAGAWDEARSAFEAAIARDADYSAAYRHLGDALDRLGRHQDAALIWAHGIRIATKTGDLQSGKEMSALLRRLERDRGVAPPEINNG